LVFLAVASCCYGQQRFGIGVKGTLRLTNDVEGWATSESKRYGVGPSVEARLWKGLGVEFDALYSRFGYRVAYGYTGGSHTEQVRGNTWEFPVLGKYRFGWVHVLGGYAARRTSGRSHGVSVAEPIIGPRSYYEYTQDVNFGTTHGVVTGGGVELGRGRVRFVPEVRYVRWNADRIGAYGSHGFSVAGTQNEVKLLLGLTLR
jgi:hypothetical protein